MEEKLSDLNVLNELIKPIKYYKSKKKEKSVFYAISNSYYHENYHSDILAYYFNYSLPKRKLIDWLNQGLDDDKKISYHDYKNGSVEREKNKIDITLFNSEGNRAIIIENKSNGATDQYRQLYRYYESLKKKNITVECICYLNKDSNKKPDFSALNTDEKAEISKILKTMYLVGTGGLCQEVVEKVVLETEKIKINALSKEIISLFNYIVYGETNMNDLASFAEELSKNNNKSKLDKILSAYNELPVYLADKYKNYLLEKASDFRIWIYKDICLVIDDIYYQKKTYAFDIFFKKSEVDISFLVRAGSEEDEDIFKTSAVKNLPLLDKRIDGRYRYNTIEPLEDDSIKNKLDELIEILSTLN